MQRRLAARPWTPREREIVEAVLGHAEARERRWADLVAALRAADPAAVAMIREQEAEAKGDVALLLERLERWDPGAPQPRAGVDVAE
jgi:hypothetical protein